MLEVISRHGEVEKLYEDVRDFLLFDGFQKIDENASRALFRKAGLEKRVTTGDDSKITLGNILIVSGLGVLLLFILELSGARLIKPMVYGPSESGMAIIAILIVMVPLGVALIISGFNQRANAHKSEVVGQDDVNIVVRCVDAGVSVESESQLMLDIIKKKFVEPQ